MFALARQIVGGEDGQERDSDDEDRHHVGDRALTGPEEFAQHVKAAIGNGISREELKDALIQVGIYCGVPAGVEAFRIATRVLGELEVGATRE